MVPSYVLFSLKEHGQILSACIVTWPDTMRNPFSAHLTPLDYRNQVMAIFDKKCSNALFVRGTALSLVVTNSNTPAQHLYTSIGFRLA